MSSKVSKNRNSLTQKKLKFAALNQLKDDHEKDENKNIEDLDFEALTVIVKEKQETVRLLERHVEEKQELIDLTEKWKEAGIQGLEELKKIIKEPHTIEQLLDSFKIPRTIFFDDDL